MVRSRNCLLVGSDFCAQSEINNAVYYAAKAGDNVKLNELISNNGMLIDFKQLYVRLHFDPCLVVTLVCTGWKFSPAYCCYQGSY